MNERLLDHIEWTVERGKPYAYHVYLHYKPKNMTIEQVSDHSISSAKKYCLNELKWRLKHWNEYKKSTMKDDE
jgi:hypothetical protein